MSNRLNRRIPSVAAGVLCALAGASSQAGEVGVWQLRQELHRDLIRTDSIQTLIQSSIIRDVHAGPPATLGFGEALRPELCYASAEGLWCAPEFLPVEPSPPEELSE